VNTPPAAEQAVIPGGLRERLRQWARRLKRKLVAFALAARDPRVPRPVRWLILGVIAYALSPVDLIPDFIPVLGLLDDLILVPLGLWLALRLIPRDIWADCEARAELDATVPSRSWVAAACIVAVWMAAVVLLARLFF
jgi:uncharacterized membrane protein YkvA (DUF1232 family)